ncbi:Holliday junction branch migration protein RuvA [Candidatus Peregrinibacteria bacterium]|nr:Holliday junction branch migration protein RuvA [Candidatus Peregrinibacteria bacterium]
MIGFLTGKIISLDPETRSMILLAQNVGYKVSVTTELVSRLKSNQETSLFIHTAVREDAISLYGFLKQEELVFFEQLMTVSGVGPKIALEILSAPMHITQTAIANEDVALLTKIKGIGRKTAERIIVDLKNKIIPVGISHHGVPVEARHGAPMQEAILALEGLGYDRMQIRKTLSQLPKEIIGTEAIIKYFLKQQ